MEIFCSTIPHIADQIFQHLDIKSLGNCKRVSKSWKNCIDRRNLVWIQVVSIPKILKNGDTYLHIAAKTGQTEMFFSILEDQEMKNPKNADGLTPFHVVCKEGHLKIAERLVRNFSELKITGEYF